MLLELGCRGLVQFAAGFLHENVGTGLQSNVRQVLADESHHFLVYGRDPGAPRHFPQEPLRQPPFRFPVLAGSGRDLVVIVVGQPLVLGLLLLLLGSPLPRVVLFEFHFVAAADATSVASRTGSGPSAGGIIINIVSGSRGSGGVLLWVQGRPLKHTGVGPDPLARGRGRRRRRRRAAAAIILRRLLLLSHRLLRRD